jgi:hypothetical protein
VSLSTDWQRGYTKAIKNTNGKKSDNSSRLYSWFP